MKIAFVVEHFQVRGGAERLEMILAEALDADVYTGYVLNESFNLAHLRVKTVFKRMNRPLIRYFYQRRAFQKIADDLAAYDIVIYFGNCLDSAPLLPDTVTKILYCHTPPRHVYADRDYYLKKYPWYIQPFYRFYTWMYRRNYEYLLTFMDCIISNSGNIQNKLRKYTGHDSTIVYPPCNIDRFTWKGQADYYLSFGRLEEVKRVDLIAKAFTQMPDKKLIIASSGPELKKIQKIAAGHDNIIVKGLVSEEEILDLVGNCIASIYVPVDEDFGMAVTESLSAGKPVIANTEGAFPEIMTNKTGILISETSVESIKAAVQSLDAETALAKKAACIERAAKFSEDNFLQGIKDIIKTYENRHHS